MEDYPTILHHGAVNGVTGSCHELRIDKNSSVLIDCGLFQGTEVSGKGASSSSLQIDFPIDHIKALLVTHVHIDHVGRIPYLLAAGFKGPIYCSEPSAVLLPLVLEDAVKIGFTKNRSLIDRFLSQLKVRLVPVPYGKWQPVEGLIDNQLSISFKRAGHILGSAYIECRVLRPAGIKKVIFSGDLGAPHTPLLPAPKSPYSADVVVLESTYGDRCHEGRKQRQSVLRGSILKALRNKGVILIPAFSIGRIQELLYELEDIIHRHRNKRVTADLNWSDLQVIVDSPLASRFTKVYRKLKPFWDAEAKGRIRQGRHPLSFDQLTTIDSHSQHQKIVNYLAHSPQPCIVLAASGMCSGGRIVNYLKALIEEPRNDILLVGYQAQGTPGRAIQQYGDSHGYVDLDGQRFTINAGVYTLPGYSAHADQSNLINFIGRMRRMPGEVRIVHGDSGAKAVLKQKLIELAGEKGVDMEVVVP